ncbi:hypothetical protein NPIL_581981, partial [Nephila pilipes]
EASDHIDEEPRMRSWEKDADSGFNPHPVVQVNISPKEED